MASPFAVLPGAVIDESASTNDSGGAPLHFGTFLREQRLLAEGRAIVHLGDRVVLSVAGADRLTWLDSITSQHLARLEPGRATELLVLDPHGHVEHAASVLDDGVTTWLIADATSAEALATWLKRMVFRAQVVVTREADLTVLGSFGGGAAEALIAPHVHAPADVPLVWIDPWSHVTVGGHQYATGPHPAADWNWRQAIVTTDAAADIAAAIPRAADVAAAGLIAAEALRIAAWRPRRANEVDERTLPHELDWLRSAVHLDKGCYRGQETVAKVHNLGHPPRRLVFLHLDGSDAVLPEPGASVSLAGTEVGRVTSAALHHELGPIALAVVKRTLPIDATLTVTVGDETVIAAQEVIVPPGAGAEASVPRLPRLSARTRA
ncbi:YgfZ/GcvT domain-containing protein [Microbacterium sp.]|jgi:folate-binding protein YgfZ|uniref:CAF17-like 4Fe-4S cluster assembly/insertion protein YgfZ n=1 Tax=Microbacterium sp. TaxID=51671 RepID=UPI0037C7E244